MTEQELKEIRQVVRKEVRQAVMDLYKREIYVKAFCAGANPVFAREIDEEWVMESVDGAR